MKKIYSVSVIALLACVTIQSYAQSIGDYRSIGNGNWNTQATWQRYTNSGWTSNQGYPGQSAGTGNVIIRSNDDVTLTASVPNAIASLVVGDGSGVSESLTFSSTSAVALVVSGNVTLSGGDLTVTNNTNPKTHTLTIGGNLSVGSNVFSAFSSPDDELEVVFNGTGNQVISGSSVAFQDLTVNKSSGSLTLNAPVSVAAAVSAGVFGTLTLTNGVIVTTSTNLLTLNNGSTVVGSSATSFVEGPLRKIGNTAFTFPVGKTGNGIHTIAISAPSSATDAFTATYFRQPSAVRGAMGTPLTAISNCEHWELVQNTGTSTVNVTIGWNPNSLCSSAYVTTLSGLTLARSSGASTWGLAAGTGTNITGTTATGSVERTGVSSFGYFALASLIAGGSPLPVMYDEVKAYAKNNGAQIEWSNLTERDIKSYRVERSANGNDYTEIAAYQPKSNRNDKASYTHFDASPLTGANYYRIRAIEVDGKNIYSKILRVEMNGTASVSVYPNPVAGRQMTISLTGMQEGYYTIRIVNANGQDMYKKQLLNKSTSTSEMIELPAAVKAGVYTMLINSDNFNTSRMFIVK